MADQEQANMSTYLRLIQHNFPQIAIQTVLPITRGWDSFVLEVNGELIFRFPMREDVVVYLQKELRLLPALEQALSTPIPHFDYIGHGDASYPHSARYVGSATTYAPNHPHSARYVGSATTYAPNHPHMFVGYRKLCGVAFEDESITPQQLAVLAPALATFLNELHSFPVEQAVQAGVQTHTPEQWRERYQERYIDLQKRAFPLLDADLRTKSERLWQDFLDDRASFVFQPVLIHCDLACEHILCDPERGELTGVIDWGDATIGDPALDFVGFYRRHGREFTERVLASYQGTVDIAFWRRMDFYLRYGPFSELLYGSYSASEKFITKGIEGLRAMFRQ